MKTRIILCSAFVGMLAATAWAADLAAATESAPAGAPLTGEAVSDQDQAQILNNPKLTQLLREASLSAGVLQVARMADLDLDEPVIQAYVEHCETPFKLKADDVFYLNEHGVSGTVITAMIERGADLRAQKPERQAQQADPASSQSRSVSQSVAIYSEPAPDYQYSYESPYRYQPIPYNPVNYYPIWTTYRPSGASTVTVIGSSYPHGMFRSARYHYPYPRVHSRLYGGTYIAFGGGSRYYGRSHRYSSHGSYRCYR